MKLARTHALPDDVVELLDDDPELLRLAARVAITAEVRPRTARRFPSAVVASAAVCVAAAVAAVVVLSGNGVGLAGRALAAVGTRPVLRAVLMRTVPTDRTVDLATGRQVPVRLSVELWLDEPSGRVRVVQRRDGALVSDRVSASGRAAAFDPTLVHFLTGYRRALRDGRVRSLGSGTVARHRVLWLALPGSSRRERVAIDATRFLPVEIETADGVRWAVSQIGSRADSASDFRPRPISSSAPSGRRATGALGLASVQALRLLIAQNRWLERQTTESSALSLRYHTPTGAVVLVQTALQALPAYGYRNGRTFGSDPIPSRESMQLASVGRHWLGQLRSDGWYLSISGPDPASVIWVARKLEARSRS